MRHKKASSADFISILITSHILIVEIASATNLQSSTYNKCLQIFKKLTVCFDFFYEFNEKVILSLFFYLTADNTEHHDSIKNSR